MSELVSSLGLWIFPVIGLVGFLAAFAVVLVRVCRATKDQMAQQGALPLHDNETITTEESR